MGLKQVLYRPLRWSRTVQAWLRRRRLSRLEAFPRMVSLELTNACNSRCIMCPRSAMTRPVGLMDDALFRRIVDEIREHRPATETVQTFFFGETLIHPRAIELLTYARQQLPWLRINLSTNGALLDEKRAEGLLDLGIDTLNIDIDGATRATAEAIRVGIPFDKVEANVLRFVERRRARNLRIPRISVSFIKMTENAHEIEAYRQKWSPIVDRIDMPNYSVWLGAVPERNLAERATESQQARFTFPCDHLWNDFVIAWDGRVAICCLDYDLQHVLGDVSKETVAQVWQGAPLRQVRDAFIEGRYLSLPVCPRCNAHIFQRGKYWEALWPVVEPLPPTAR